MVSVIGNIHLTQKKIRFAAQQTFLFATLFCFYKNNIFKAQSANRIFFSVHLRDIIFFLNQICRQNFFLQKTIAPPPPLVPIAVYFCQCRRKDIFIKPLFSTHSPIELELGLFCFHFIYLLL